MRGPYIVEDDYDGEYRYDIQPIRPLHSFEEAAHVIYLGTISKTLSPLLRLGYLVLPPELVDAFRAAKRLIDRHSPTLEQDALAGFIQSGVYERHIRKLVRVLHRSLTEQEVRGLHRQRGIGPSRVRLDLQGRPDVSRAAPPMDMATSVESAASQGGGQVREHAEEFVRVMILGQAGGSHSDCRLDDWHNATFKQVVRQSDLQQADADIALRLEASLAKHLPALSSVGAAVASALRSRARSSSAGCPTS